MWRSMGVTTTAVLLSISNVELASLERRGDVKWW